MPADPPLPRRGPRPAPFRKKELAALGGIVVLTDLLFWSASASTSESASAKSGRDGFVVGGFGLALFFLVVPVVAVLAARASRRSTRLAVAAALLALVALRCVFDPNGGTVVAGLGLLVFFAIALRAKRAFLPEAGLTALVGFARVVPLVRAVAQGAKTLAGRDRLRRIPVAPVLVPAALCAVFGGVFALANPVVAHGVGVVCDAITSTVRLPAIPRLFLWATTLVAGASLLRPAVRLAKGAETKPAEGDATTSSLLVARNTLGALNVLFLVYNALDAAYLWTGAPPAGMPTRLYAHAGAFWLTIALVLLTCVIGVMFRGPLAHDARAELSRKLAYVWMAQGLVLALGTYRRIAIHVAWSGLSDLRIVGILGTTLVVVGVVLVAKKLHEQRTFTWLVRRQLDAFALTLALYAVFPTHLVSARYNVSRIESGEYRPVLHMFVQAHRPESAAALVPLLHHPDVRVRQGVAALLESERAQLRTERSEESSWRQRDLASAHALAALDAAAPEVSQVLADTDRNAARDVLLEISRVANERSLEELLTVPTAAEVTRSRRSRSDYVQ